MSTQITIDLDVNAIKALELAYDTLLSVGKINKLFVGPKINKNLLYACGCNTIKYGFKDDLVTLITVNQIKENKCKLTITTEPIAGVSPARGSVLLFISDFLEKFNETLCQSGDGSVID